MLTRKMSDRFPVEVLDENKEHLMDADSISQAAKLSKTDDSTVWRYLFIKTKAWRGKQPLRTTGVLSREGKRYHFKLKQ